MKYKVCIVTGTRAEYGILKPLIDRIVKDKEFELKLVVTGTHLSEKYGYTCDEIESDGYDVSKKIALNFYNNNASSLCEDMGIILKEFSEYLSNEKPQLVIILGDRYEILAIATATMICRIPIAHIHGGEKTEGAIDEAIRHSISKMSQIHFVATEEYRKRVIQLGEQPKSVFNVGALGVENIKNEKLMSKEELENSIGYCFNIPTLLVTFHPETLEVQDIYSQVLPLLKFLDNHKEFGVIFTKANADEGGLIINSIIEQYVQGNSDRCVVYSSLGRIRYLSTLQYVDCVIGNSSSGLCEVPSFHIPTINIGERQKGRVAAESVIQCNNTLEEIEKAFNTAINPCFKKKILECKNPYEGYNTSKQIVDIIKNLLSKGINLKKTFFDIL